MKKLRIRRLHIVCLGIATAEIIVVALVLWNHALKEKMIFTTQQHTEIRIKEDAQAEEIKKANQENKTNDEVNQKANELTALEKIIADKKTNMRVKLKSSDGTSYEHEKIIVSCPDTFHLKAGEKEQIFTGGQTVTITYDHPLFAQGQILVTAEKSNITIESIIRRGEVHDYEGILELYRGTNGIIVINELPLEEYVSRVVPSEMPAYYGIEAAKLQAVCARTYAYERIINAKVIDEYGAYADDSVDYQVYNSAGYQEVSASGTNQTEGIIMKRDNVPIVPYYFSTSCGYTSDNTAWSGSENALPYICSLNLTQEKQINMTDELSASAFLQNWNASGLEAEMAWYRWRCEISIENMQMLFRERITQIREIKNEYVTSTGDELTNILNSQLYSVQVETRLQGGMAGSVRLTYEKGEIIVKGELCIRKLLSEPTRTYQNKSQTQISLSEGNYLPSAFFCLIPIQNGAQITGYTICGGGNGHGIGLSQNAAYKMLSQGKSWEEILVFFYQGIAFDTIS